MSNVHVIMGSVRHGRRCPAIAAWVMRIAAEASDLSYEIVDLAEWPLPMDDEPDIPARGRYEHAHTRAWSEKIASGDAFVFVTPQYNWGYPAALKNAIDHLYKEWSGKPAVIVTYGGNRGSKCAVAFRGVTEGVHMRPMATMPGLKLSREVIEGRALDPETDFEAEDAEAIRQAIGELVLDLDAAT